MDILKYCKKTFFGKMYLLLSQENLYARMFYLYEAENNKT